MLLEAPERSAGFFLKYIHIFFFFSLKTKTVESANIGDVNGGFSGAKLIVVDEGVVVEAFRGDIGPGNGRGEESSCRSD